MRRRSNRRLQPTVASSGTDPNLAILLAAPGAQVIYNADYGYTKDVSNKVSGLSAQLGSYTLAQATGAQQPTYGITSPTGRVGITFAGAQRLVDPASTLASQLGGTQQLSTLSVSTCTSLAAIRVLWGIGSTASLNEFFYESVNTTGGRRFGRASAGASTQTIGTVLTTVSTIHTATQTLTTNAASQSAWEDGTVSVNASASLSGKTPTATTFAIGANVQNNVWLLPYVGDFYFLIISTSIWSTPERQALEAAAKAYFGTP